MKLAKVTTKIVEEAIKQCVMGLDEETFTAWTMHLSGDAERIARFINAQLAKKKP